MDCGWLDESDIQWCIGQGDDAGTFVCCRSNEMHKDDHLKKTTKFPNSFIIWGCMSSKGPGEMTILTSTVNGQVYIEILDTFLIPLIEKKFGDDVIFQDDNASWHRAKIVKAFLQERHINSMTWPANSLDLNPIGNLWWKLKKTGPWQGSILQSWSVNRYSRRLEPAWWRILFFISEIHAPKNSGRHKSKRRTNKVLTVCSIFFPLLDMEKNFH